MLKFGTLRKQTCFSDDYLGSVGCFDSDGDLIARCVRNIKELEDENFQPLTVQEAMAMLESGKIDPDRLNSWSADPCSWNCWELMDNHPDPVSLKRAIATAYSALMTAETLATDEKTDEGDEKIIFKQ